MSFTPSEFHYNPCRYGCEAKDLPRLCEILNTLTPEQEKAVRAFGDSRREDGFDDGYDNGSEESSD